jgi:type IV pilus assembly protein PilO
MATQAKDRGANFVAAMRGGLGQFNDLNLQQPGQWPFLPRLTAWTLVVIVVAVIGWFAALSDQSNDLQAARDKEPALKNEYRTKLAQAINLDALKKQKEDVQTYVTQLEKQLPGQAERPVSAGASSSTSSFLARPRPRSTTPSCRSPSA